MLAPRGAIAKEGDVILVFRGHRNVTPLLLRRGEVLHCQEGKFRHDDIIGRPLGTRVGGQSNVKRETLRPSILVLQNSADLWVQAVPHRTQIIYDTDIAVIIQNLRLGPNCRVAEAGTGSGSLTHALARAVAPRGTVFTFDFHRGRCVEARQELRRNGIAPSLVTCNWRDVCSSSNNNNKNNNGNTDNAEHHRQGDILAGVEEEITGEDPPHGFGLPAAHVDAVFLDVPAPWLAVENVLHVLRPGGMLCTFSPCIEQTQRTAQRLRQAPFSFMDIRTVEALTKHFTPIYKRGRDGNDEEAKGQWKFRAAPVSKGHSAYLTFARRRLDPLETNNNDKSEDNDDAEDNVEGNGSKGEENNNNKSSAADGDG